MAASAEVQQCLRERVCAADDEREEFRRARIITLASCCQGLFEQDRVAVRGAASFDPV
jgi:hypothetical protein